MEFLEFLSLVGVFKASKKTGKNRLFAEMLLVGLFKLKTRRDIHFFCFDFMVFIGMLSLVGVFKPKNAPLKKKKTVICRNAFGRSF